MMSIEFADRQVLFLLGVIPVMIILYVMKHRSLPTVLQISTIGGVRNLRIDLKVISRHSLFILRMMGVAALIFALARPQQILSKQMIRSEGIDIMIVLDVSGSMLTKDFVPDRLSASKTIAAKFIDGRPNDRIGLVVFAGETYAASPVTIDHESLKTILNGVQPGNLENGTAIGLGLGAGVNHLLTSRGKSRIVILMTDGANNAGNILPVEAAQLALANGIRVYAIGMEPYEGQSVSEGTRRNAIPAMMQSSEELLLQIASVTGGHYFHAMDEKNLASIYKEIDSMEKTRVDVASYKENREMFFPFVWMAVALVMFEMILRYTFFKSV